jgi:hypothetical protein
VPAFVVFQPFTALPMRNNPLAPGRVDFWVNLALIKPQLVHMFMMRVDQWHLKIARQISPSNLSNIFPIFTPTVFHGVLCCKVSFVLSIYGAP